MAPAARATRPARPGLAPAGLTTAAAAPLRRRGPAPARGLPPQQVRAPPRPTPERVTSGPPGAPRARARAGRRLARRPRARGARGRRAPAPARPAALLFRSPARARWWWCTGCGEVG